MKRHQNETDSGAPVATEEARVAPEAPAAAVQTGGEDEVAARLVKAEAEAAEMKDAWLRAKAETENVRKQAEANVAKAHKYAVERFAEDLLAVKDALEQTLAAGDVPLETLKSGAALTLKALQASFDRAQVVELNPVGENYDPHRHQAMQMVESDQPPNTVVDVFQKGYLINDRVLRPALVTVAKGRTENSQPQRAGSDPG
jgi:molecular chaperone GrpE